jgi:hypothetical protein
MLALYFSYIKMWIYVALIETFNEYRFSCLGGLRRLRDDSMGLAGATGVEQFYSLRSTLPVMSNTIKTVAANRIMPPHFSR